MPAWPGTLPTKPLQDGFSEGFPTNIIRTDMEIGPAKVRKRQTVGIRPFEVKYIFDGTELNTFRTFFNTTLQFGALSFDWFDPQSGAGVTARFINPPVIQSEGSLFSVTASIEILP